MKQPINQLYLALPGLIRNTGPAWGTILQETKQHMRVKGIRDRPGAVREMPFLGWVSSIMAGEGDGGTAPSAAQPVTVSLVGTQRVPKRKQCSL